MIRFFRIEEELKTKISVMTKLSYGEDSNIKLYTDESVDNPGYIWNL